MPVTAPVGIFIEIVPPPAEPAKGASVTATKLLVGVGAQVIL